MDWLVSLWVGIKNQIAQLRTAGKNKKVLKQVIESAGLKDDKDVVNYLNKVMKYKWDPLHGAIDIQSMFMDLVDNGFRGDCDDYQMAAHQLLTELGYQSFVVTMVSDDLVKSHVICVYKKNGKFYTYSTDGHHGPFNSLDEIIEYENKLFNTHYVQKDIRYGYLLSKVHEINYQPRKMIIGRRAKNADKKALSKRGRLPGRG